MTAIEFLKSRSLIAQADFYRCLMPVPPPPIFPGVERCKTHPLDLGWECDLCVPAERFRMQSKAATKEEALERAADKLAREFGWAPPQV